MMIYHTMKWANTGLEPCATTKPTASEKTTKRAANRLASLAAIVARGLTSLSEGPDQRQDSTCSAVVFLLSCFVELNIKSLIF